MKSENAYAFPFHYGQEAESYTFYRVPKILFTAEAFDHLSTDAKLLYGILLDRMQLSVKNRWIDADGKVFIYYPRQNHMDLRKMMAERLKQYQLLIAFAAKQKPAAAGKE